MIEISIEADVEAATKQLYRYEREIIPKAASSAINKTMTNTITAVNRYISRRTGLKIKELKANQYRIRSSRFTLAAILVNHMRRPVNIIRFVTPGKRQPGAFRKQKGVSANPWKTRRLFEGAFIVMGRSGKPFVAVRTSRNRSGIRGVHGPSLNKEIVRPGARQVIRATVNDRFRINFERDLNYFLLRAR